MSRFGEVAPGRQLTAPANRTAPRAGLVRVWLRLFTLSESEALFSTRGFVASDLELRNHLEAIGTTFISGYNLGLTEPAPGPLREALESLHPARRGFLVEGAAMGVAIADGITPGQTRLPVLLSRYRDSYTYLLHAGIGWALARMPWRGRTVRRLLDPVHHWLVYDGLGFHDAYFHSRRLDRGWRRVKKDYGARAYDQGIGRGLWFTSGGDVQRAAQAISRRREAEHADLWSGLGLAVAYAGGCAPAEVSKLIEVAGVHRGHLVQGTAFAAEAHGLAGHLPRHTQRTVERLAGIGAREVVSVVREARAALPEAGEGAQPRYETWRQDVRRILLERSGVAP